MDSAERLTGAPAFLRARNLQAELRALSVAARVGAALACRGGGGLSTLEVDGGRPKPRFCASPLTLALRRNRPALFWRVVLTRKAVVYVRTNGHTYMYLYMLHVLLAQPKK